MKWYHHLFSAIQFFQVLLLVMGGVFCFILPFAPALRITIANSFLFKDALFFSMGLILVIVGVILGIGFYFLQRHQMLQLSMNPSATVDAEVIASTVQIYLQNRFPSHLMKTEARVDHQGTLELLTDLPPEMREKHLKEMEIEIGRLLESLVGYRKNFRMTFTS